MVKMKGIQMVSNHGFTLELNEERNEFNGVKAPEGGFFLSFGSLGSFGFCVWLVWFLSLLFSWSQLEREFPRS